MFYKTQITYCKKNFILKTAAISKITFVSDEMYWLTFKTEYSTNTPYVVQFCIIGDQLSINIIRRGLRWVGLNLTRIIIFAWLEMCSLYQSLTSPAVHVIKMRQWCNLTLSWMERLSTLTLPFLLKADSYWWVCKTNWCN